MANCKSIRLDFPAAGLSISDDEIITLMQNAFIYCATARIKKGEQDAGKALARACVNAHVDNYDDRYGGPVFYIP